jgi:hypothetical protein
MPDVNRPTPIVAASATAILTDINLSSVPWPLDLGQPNSLQTGERPICRLIYPRIFNRSR